MARSTTAERGATRPRNGTAPAAGEVIGRQREEFGGINWGAAFFGWLVAIGVAAVAIVLVTLLAAVAGGKQGTHYHRKIDRTGY